MFVKIPADYVIVAAGPWSQTILPNIPIGGARNNSLLLRVPSTELVADMVSFNTTPSTSALAQIICPPPTDLVSPDKDICIRIRRAAEFVSSRLQGRELLIEQACYRPVVTIPGRDRVSGLIVATSHDNWGIQNSPSTGKIVSELVFDRVVTSADISSLYPGDVA